MKTLRISLVLALSALPAAAQQFTQVLYSPNPIQSTGNFGQSLASEGNLLVVGAPGEYWTAGRAYIFTRTGPTTPWFYAATLQGPPPSLGGDFGKHVGLLGNRAVVTCATQFAPAGGSGAGAVHIYDLTDPFQPVLEETVFATGGSAIASFGTSVAMSDRWLVVGSEWETDPATGNWSGVVFAFERVAGAWVERARFAPVGSQSMDHFGWRVALHGDLVLASSLLGDNMGERHGAAFLFDLTTTPPTQLARIDRTHAVPGSTFDVGFGLYLGLSERQALVGDVGSTPGVVYRYVPNTNGTSWQWDTTITGGEQPGGASVGAVLDDERFVQSRPFDSTDPANLRGRYVLMRRCRGRWTHTDAGLGAPPGLHGTTIAGFQSVINGDQLIAGSNFVTVPPYFQTGAVLIGDISTLFQDAPCLSLGESLCVPAPGQCPCGAAGGADTGCANSTGLGARLRASGQPSVSHEALLLHADQMPAETLTIFALRPGWTGVGVVPTVRGAGISCMTGNPTLTFPRRADARGVATVEDPLPSSAALVGTRMQAEVRYRDRPSATCGTGFNVSNGLVFWVMH